LLLFFELFALFFEPPFFAAMDLFSLPLIMVRNDALLQLFDCIESFKIEVKRKILGTKDHTLDSLKSFASGAIVAGVCEI